MPHQSRWLVEKRLLIIVYDGEIDRAEMQQLNCELDIYLSEGEAPVHIISDHRTMGEAHIDLNITRETFSAMKKHGWGYIVFVAVPPLIRFFANVFGIQYGLRIKSARSIEAAIAFLENEDSSLSSESKN
jgi:hypothetical protein